MNAASTDALNLVEPTNPGCGSSRMTSFSKVKAVFIVNRSTAGGEDLVLSGGGTEIDRQGGPPLENGSNPILVPANTAVLLVDRGDGWVVGRGAIDVVRVSNRAARPVPYAISIVGICRENATPHRCSPCNAPCDLE